MTQKQQLLRIFLHDGIPDGLRTAEIMMSTIEAFAFKRSLLSRAKKELNLKRPGVYALISDTQADAEKIAYIGETEDLSERLYTHDKDKGKDFWVETLVFASKDENLTKAHVRYIEAELMMLAQKNPLWSIPNKTQPKSAGKLPKSDQAPMNDFVFQAKIIASTLGYDLFKTIADTIPIVQKPNAQPTTSPVFEMKGAGYHATGVHDFESGDFLVQAGSIAKAIQSPSLPGGSRKLLSELIKAEVLVKTSQGLEFASNFHFSSPSSAANIVTGSATNGRTSWKTNEKVSYADFLSSHNNDEEQKILELGAEGGSISLWRIKQNEFDGYRLDIYDSSLAEIDDSEKPCNAQKTFKTWDEAIVGLPGGWESLYPVFVNEIYWPLISTELSSRGVNPITASNWLVARNEC